MAYTLLDDETPKGYRLLEDVAQADPKIGQPEELTVAEKLAQMFLPDALGDANIRGSAIGRLAKGASDPGVAVAQVVANATGFGDEVNKAIQGREVEYQNARKQAGSEGFDPLRVGGAIGIESLVAPLRALKPGIAAGAGVGAISGALQPVTDAAPLSLSDLVKGREAPEFWWDKLKQATGGAVMGGASSALFGALARGVSPKASTNADIALLKKEGANPSIGQTLGGWANALEEKAQSLPIMGPAIRAARQRGGEQLEGAGFNRALGPIGQSTALRGHEGIADTAAKLGAEYDRILPQMGANVLEPGFVQRMANLRGMVQGLPQSEREMFDAVISREIDGRVAPNGVLSGQNLKDAWIALREAGKKFSRSGDGYQQDLGQAFKQAFTELKDHVTANNPTTAPMLKAADLGYANFKRLQRAASSVAADGGRPSPAQLHNAVKAMDSSKDKARFAGGDALMQDLSGAGKRVLSNKVPDSGTAGRAMLGGLGAGALFEPVTALSLAGGLGVGAVGYTRPVQNALVALVSKRPDMAPVVANYLRQLQNPAALAGSTAVMQDQY